jgi:hypothetical protein
MWERKMQTQRETEGEANKENKVEWKRQKERKVITEKEHVKGEKDRQRSGERVQFVEQKLELSYNFRYNQKHNSHCHEFAHTLLSYLDVQKTDLVFVGGERKKRQERERKRRK